MVQFSKTSYLSFKKMLRDQSSACENEKKIIISLFSSLIIGDFGFHRGSGAVGPH